MPKSRGRHRNVALLPARWIRVANEEGDIAMSPLPDWDWGIIDWGFDGQNE